MTEEGFSDRRREIVLSVCSIKKTTSQRKRVNVTVESKRKHGDEGKGGRRRTYDVLKLEHTNNKYWRKMDSRPV